MPATASSTAPTPAAPTRYAFRLELPNELAAVNDELVLFFFPHAHGGEDEVEVFDPRRRRAYLSRRAVTASQLRLDDIALGSCITLFGRQYAVVAYEDAATRRALEVTKERAVALVPRGALGRAWASAERAGLRVVGAALFTPSAADAAALSTATVAPVAAAEPLAVLDVQGPSAHVTVAAQLQQAPLGAADGEPHWVTAATDRDSDARLRSMLLLPGAGALGSDSLGRRGGLLLPCAQQPAGRLRGCTCVLVLPTAVARRQAGAILADLQAALLAPAAADDDGGAGGGGDVNDAAAAAGVDAAEEGGTGSAAAAAAAASASASSPLSAAGGRSLRITALTVAQLTRPQAERFLAVYKGVLREYPEMVAELCSGPLVALEVSGQDAVQRVRALAGPRDVDVALRVRPHSLRARYGQSSSMPALHVTDLPEDGPLEVEAIFTPPAAAAMQPQARVGSESWL